MKILLINDYFEPKSGAETYLLKIGKELSKKHELHVIAFSNSFTNKERVFYCKFSTNPLLKYMQRFFFSFNIYKTILNQIKKIDPEIIHLHNNNQYSLSVLYAIKHSKIPPIQTIHDWGAICSNGWCVLKSNLAKCTGTKGIGLKCLYNRCISPSHFFIALIRNRVRYKITKEIFRAFISPSKALSLDLKKYNFKRVYVNPSFIYPDEYSSLNKFPLDVILYVGSLSKNKGVNYLIESMQEISKKITDVNLIIIGDGEERGSLENLSKELDLNKSITFMGRLDNKEVQNQYKKAKVLVIPSIWMENLPFVIAEALASGLPIIGPNRGGILDLVENGKNGFLVEPGNPEILANKIICILDKKQKDWLETSKKSRQIANEKLNVEKHVAKLEEIYNAYKVPN